MAASRRPTAEVPELGGLTVRAAEDAVLDAGLLPHQVSPGAETTCSERAARAVVRGQRPGPHTRVSGGTQVCFWCTTPGDDPPDGGGGGGALLPQGPRPLSPSGAKTL